MKKLMLLGAFLGFLIGLSFGVLQETPWPSVLWRASVAAAAAGLLLRWWGNQWVRGLREAHAVKMASPALETVSAAASASKR
jgi:hypothetical protein